MEKERTKCDGYWRREKKSSGEPERLEGDAHSVKPEDYELRPWEEVRRTPESHGGL